jgi:hypothetical protein
VQVGTCLSGTVSATNCTRTTQWLNYLLYSDNVKFYHIRIVAARTTRIDEIFLSD